MSDNKHIQNILQERFKLVTKRTEITSPLYLIAEAQLRKRASRKRLHPPVRFDENDIPSPATQHIGMQALLNAPLYIPNMDGPLRYLGRLAEVQKPDPQKTCTAIGADPKMTAAVLKLANTRYYGSPGTVDTVSRAVSLIGVKQSIVLALGSYQFIQSGTVLAKRFEVQKFWQHSLACAYICREIGRRMHPGKEEPFYVTGLLHDLGRLIIAGSIPESDDEILRYVSLRGLPVAKAERQVLGFDHAELGKTLFRMWGLPDKISLAIGEHHSLPAVLSPVGTAMSLADNLSKAFGLGTGVNYYVRDIPDSYLQRCNIQKSDWPEFVFATFEKTKLFLRQIARRFTVR